MISRRNFVTSLIKVSTGVFLGLGGLAQSAGAAAKRKLLPKGTSAERLSHLNPQNVDASQLGITPLEKFETMGLSDHRVDIGTWRLEVAGKVDAPMSLDYSQVKSLPMVERKELLICPGVFSYKALYQGVLLKVLLAKAGLGKEAKEVIISGPRGSWSKKERFTLGEIHAGRVFLAWSVNGRPLPIKHGFPLRVVAPDHYGDDWVKYADKVEVL
ncbi:MAG: molybdopterin-dependent oxidoreductase [Deltaproteobacteria bacterium]|nr:molybdopterin-dependent oxidoreductase [Deltaproteobacteria bacterium]